MKQVLVLTGHYAGKTVKLGHHQFVDGSLTLEGAPQELDGAIKYLGRCYQAHPTGSDELAAAQKRDAFKKEQASGFQHRTQVAVEASGAERVQGERASTAGQVQTPGSVSSGSAHGASGGKEGVLPDGHGHKNSGLLPEEVTAIQTALSKLDPAIEDQWTPDGLPTVEVVAQVTGNPKLTRAMIEAAAPKFTRQVAEDARELSAL